MTASATTPAPLTIAITGAAGLVGSGLRRQLLAAGHRIVSLDLRPITDPAPEETAHVVDIGDQAALTTHLRGVDGIVHLAACTTDAPWPDQVRLSIEGTISLFDAARAAGVRRIAYASSHHVVGLHPRAPHGPRMGDTAILRPDSRYAVGKAFGENIGALYACKYGLQVLAIRIGNVNTRPIDRRRLGSWISERDLAQLVTIGLTHPDVAFDIVYGISDASGRHYDNATAHALGYRPQDSSEGWDETVLREDPPPAAGSDAAHTAAELTLGGGFSQAEFEGDGRRVLHRSPR
ncbi:NAD-dependent epimerase/dehydratase family protein [Pseudaquabacterium rugosum]|uniref:NAD(P)-dependent oxidoreductase n=1 Tax=Pseudaquabacterium rugosum TaxID=2984194 RepID=A0ABU9BHH7_9BURK